MNKRTLNENVSAISEPGFQYIIMLIVYQEKINRW